MAFELSEGFNLQSDTRYTQCPLFSNIDFNYLILNKFHIITTEK